ncbi:hypothetical protein SAMN05216548_108188 [Faunimonas pinastri]|uniref:Uncharacterized protein n=1 Tax=Faunimonas pinastri TaxID=1855383 RepID=A0A1H9JMW2_9HYPH|nr:hypothetical protein [Faunimonas pinastri]SEQ88129.1 hypothetical protein SAMN05216548_108188 [Faunimonas pinastri]
MTRAKRLYLINGADGRCERTEGGVSLICRMMVASRMVQEDKVCYACPYSETLYKISTGGKTYDR